MFDVIERTVGEAAQPARIHTVMESQIFAFVQTKSVAKTIVQAVLSRSVLILGIAEAVGRLVDKWFNERYLHDNEEVLTTTPDNNLLNRRPQYSLPGHWGCPDLSCSSGTFETIVWHHNSSNPNHRKDSASNGRYLLSNTELYIYYERGSGCSHKSLDTRRGGSLCSSIEPRGVIEQVNTYYRTAIEHLS